MQVRSALRRAHTTASSRGKSGFVADQAVLHRLNDVASSAEDFCSRIARHRDCLLSMGCTRLTTF